jgi:transcription initiation factor TFIIIB Brf1 subunit/transcription initiation factor TFIIB
MNKVLEDGTTVCLDCGIGLDGVLIDFETERGEAAPDCNLCGEREATA